MSSSTALIERIAQNVLAVVQGVTVANGFQYTLTAARHLAKGDKRQHLHAIIVQEKVQDLPQAVNYTKERWQLFSVAVNVMPADEDPTPVDSYCNAVIADIERALRADPQRGGLAIDTQMREPVIAPAAESNCDLAIVACDVHYRTMLDDPRQQA